MKRLLVLVFCVLGLLLLTAPTAVESYPLYVNSHRIGNAQNVRGIIAVSVQDIAKAAGGTLTLEDAGLTINGGALFTSPVRNLANKKYQKADITDGTSNAQGKVAPVVKVDRPALLRVNRPNVPIGNTINGDGKEWISVHDLAHALGTTFTGGVRAGQRIDLRSTPQGILIGL